MEESTSVPKLDTHLERKITTNNWIIRTRWFYPVGILLIGLLTKILSQSNLSFSYVSMLVLFFVYLLANGIFYLLMKYFEKTGFLFVLNTVSFLGIINELIFLTIIMHLAGGIESIAVVFFFLPVVTSSLLFGAGGSIITALISGLLINLLVVAEYHGFIGHVSRYGISTLEFQNLPIALTKTITTSIFFLIIGLVSGYGSNMLFSREEALEQKKRQADEQAKILTKQSQELIFTNEELDKKIKEMEKIQNLVVGRELRMVELKEEIRKLKEKQRE